MQTIDKKKFNPYKNDIFVLALIMVRSLKVAGNNCSITK